MPAAVSEKLKTCLSLAGGCLLALSLAACTQTVEPEPEPEEPILVRQPGRADWGLSSSARIVTRVKVDKPYVALTFDDGPHRTLTPRVLDILKKHGAHATFFVLGRSAVGKSSILARMVEEGHEVGNHSWSHINMRSSSEEQIFREMDRTNATIERATGYTPWVMRPPYGAFNSRLANSIYKRYGTPAILWDVDTQDWRRPGVQKVVRRAVDRARPGSVILLHDIHPSTIAAVEDIVTGLQARGFKLVTVSELLASGPAGAPRVKGGKKTEPAEAPTAVSGEKEAGGEAFTSQKQPPLPEETPAAAKSAQPIAEPLPPALLKPAASGEEASEQEPAEEE